MYFLSEVFTQTVSFTHHDTMPYGWDIILVFIKEEFKLKQLQQSLWSLFIFVKMDIIFGQTWRKCVYVSLNIPVTVCPKKLPFFVAHV